ncbi:Holliday junction resolvase [Pseudomonas aeruginosa VRFPA06]|nr:DUF2388 domain-containing protein [Pseudomonas aeruginosa]ETD94579.1 Holliday junction resolvase [Pseudomonas aeruginosa VRFPA06]HCE7281164.1 DUF2388 domain-containing protein [Pseudomonas aeruginosa]
MFKLWKRKKRRGRIWLFHIVFSCQICVAAEVSDGLEELARGTVILTVMGTSATGHTSDHFGHNSYAYAREDAAAFVASEGAIYGVQLERAWRKYQADTPEPRLELSSFATGLLARSEMQ